MRKALMVRNWTKTKKVIVAFVAITGVLMIAILPGVFWELHEANKALRDFNSSLIAKDYVRAYSLTAPELQRFTDYKAFVKVHEDLNTKLGNLAEAEINQTEVNDQRDGWFATTSVHLIFRDASLPFTFVLKKEGPAWKVYSYHQQ
jgi:hypothetical protein